MSEKYKVITVPNPILKQTAHPVDKVDSDLQTQFDRMYTTMREGNGIGLAANQVGLLNRVMVIHIEQFQNPQSGAVEDTGILYMANPEIIWESEERSSMPEGCLSLPGQFAEIERPAIVRVKYLDYDGKIQEKEVAGLLSHCVQHELDHLDGGLFVDYLSRLKRDMIIKRVRRYTKLSGIEKAAFL